MEFDRAGCGGVAEFLDRVGGDDPHARSGREEPADLARGDAAGTGDDGQLAAEIEGDRVHAGGLRRRAAPGFAGLYDCLNQPQQT